MADKKQRYSDTMFKAEVLEDAFELMRTLCTDESPKKDMERIGSLSISRKTEAWNYDTVAEFFADYRKGNFEEAQLRRRIGTLDLSFCVFHYNDLLTQVTVSGRDRASIETVFALFDRHADQSKVLPQIKAPQARRPTVFIGHGRSAQWRDLKDHLQDSHGYVVSAYEIGARAGHAIRDVLDEMLAQSSMAFLVMTGEDELVDGSVYPRLNVVHELGLFQGRLGFSRAIALLEDGTKEFSNIHGIEQIRFARGSIRETFGDVLAVIGREFPSERKP